MRLANNRPRFEHAKAYLRRITQEMLDTSVTYTQQDPVKLEAFIETVLEEYPFFKKYYEDHWPVTSYVRLYLKSRACNHRKKWNSKGPRGRTETTRDRSVIKRPAAAEISQGSERTAVQSPVAIANVTSASSSSEPSSTPPSQTCVAVPHPSLETWPLLGPDLCHLIPALMDAGMRSEAALHSLVNWPRCECEALLKVDIGLSAYEARSILIRLAALKTNSLRSE